MSRTFRRKTKKSQNMNKRIHNIWQDKLNDDWYYFSSLKNDERFFTDNQSVPNHKNLFKIMNKKVRLEGKFKLHKFIHSGGEEEVVLLYYKGKHYPRKESYMYN